MRESRIEQYLKKRVVSIGGISRKFVSPGHRGVPDRIVILPGGLVYFVELKAPGAKPRADQRRELDLLVSLGCHVAVLDSILQVDEFIEKIKRDEEWAIPTNI